MADLSEFNRGQIVDARMAGSSVTKIKRWIKTKINAELFGVASTVSEVMTAFEKEGKPPHWSKTLEESEICLIGTVKLLREFWGRITRIQLQKIQQGLMTISRTQFPQKLYEESKTKTKFTGGLQSENHIKINLFEISTCFHYFVQPL